MLKTISCDECGHEIATDDFIMEHCPLCDGYMRQTRLAQKAYPERDKIIRVPSNEKHD